MPTISSDASSTGSLAALFTSARKDLAEVENRARQYVAKADSDAHDARLERDKALEALHAAQLKTQELQEEVASMKAMLNQTELCVSHQMETIAQLRREATQWKDQSCNWQEHFLRVEQERCSLTTRVEELVSERLQWSRSLPTPFTPNHPAINTSLSATSPKPRRTSISSRKRPTSPSDVDLPSNSMSGCKSTRMTSKPIQVRKNKDSTPTQRLSSGDSSTSTSNQNSNIQSTQTRHCPSKPTQSLSHTTILRRVHAIVNVKQEESDEQPEAEDIMTSPRPAPLKKRKAIFHDKIYASEEESDRAPSGNDQSPEYEDNEEAIDDEDDELMLGGQTHQGKRGRAFKNASGQYTPTLPSKKRKTMAIGRNKPHTRWKD